MTYKIISLLLISLFTTNPFQGQSLELNAEIIETGNKIREAFLNGDVSEIMKYHHPSVTKALAFDNYLIGRESVAENLEGTLNSFDLEFIENEIESIEVFGEIAIEQTIFSIKGTPKEGGDSWVFRGRTQVTYIRYSESPTGWATIREIIQVPS